MSRHDAHVLLVRPGDVLLIGNAGSVDPEALAGVAQSLKDTLGLRHVVVFDDDIDLDAVTPALSAPANGCHCHAE